MIVLASQSPRRKEILTRAGIAFTTRVSGIPEVPAPGESPADYVRRLALEKSAAVDPKPEEYVLAADTTVVVDDHLLEKPHSEADAIRMLRLLAGRDHVVLTGVCLRHNGQVWSAVESTTVTFSPMTADEIRAYAASGEPFDKAGGYAIQGLASKFIPRVEGCYLNVVGLPVAAVYGLLKQAGYSLALG